ncbi:MAG: ATP-binding cassette domain-containing protein [Opitutae bacterium]|nr:ATP-binding cassette domain-containing protein [Opitutae bacterium]
MSLDEPVLRVDQLTIERNGYLLKDICWQVMPRENWVILGANGSGKTVLLKSLTGYFPPTRGDISVLGNTYGNYDWNRVRLRIGMVSSSIQQRIGQGERAIEVVVSGKYAQVNYWGPISKKDRVRARSLMERLECEYLLDKTWITLSQGERQRLLIARALMAKAEILILDEPCAGLDPVAREQFLNALENLNRHQPDLSLLLVTHHVEEITPCFTHCLLLGAGEVVSQGPIGTTMSSASLSITFDKPLKLKRSNGRYRLQWV